MCGTKFSHGCQKFLYLENSQAPDKNFKVEEEAGFCRLVLRLGGVLHKRGGEPDPPFAPPYIREPGAHRVIYSYLHNDKWLSLILLPEF